MIRLQVKFGDRPPKIIEWDEAILSIGRSPTNDVVVDSDNISSQHAQICLVDGRYVFRDLHSTNGSLIVRHERKYLLRNDQLEMPLEIGDVACLASLDNSLAVDSIEDRVLEDDEDADNLEKTILAAEAIRPDELETTLGQDHDALRSVVRLAREMAVLDATGDISRLACQTCLRAFPKARASRFLRAHGDRFVVEYIENREGQSGETTQTYSRSHELLSRCLNERKGFLFLFEGHHVQAIATRISAIEDLQADDLQQNQMLLCCPLMHDERCLGFLIVEAPFTKAERHGLSRRDLSLATLMGHLIAARLYELETQNERLKLARKATAGYLAATVGHCFKNLLFVPMSLSRMLPICLAQGKMDEVKWMLARNGVSIRYLDILSNEFAAASKDPTEGFEDCSVVEILKGVAELVNQIAPEKVTAHLTVPEELPPAHCHGAALKRLLMNLALNSVDALFGAANDRPGRIDLEAAHDARRDVIRLGVRDNGPGIPPPILDNLRNIFAQVRASADALGELEQIAERVRSTKEQGFKEHYGLGFLFVCQTVHQHKGNLTIEAKPGEGTCFTISFPRVRPEKTSA